jgi:hypothetical protein
MKKYLLLTVLMVVAVMLAACGADKVEDTVTLFPGENGSAVILPSEESTPADMPARPDSGVTGDPSANLPDLVEVTGTVKEVNEGLVLISRPDTNEDFMLRFSENTKWDEGVNKELCTGNTIKCLVKLEPTFTTPSQGEVYEVIENNV